MISSKPQILFLFFLIGISEVCFANGFGEKFYQEKWCSDHNGRTEVIMADGTRCDCLTKTHAVEVDFAHKWAEAIGQALHYASQTGRRAGVIMVVDGDNDTRYLHRLKSTIEYHQLEVDVWQTQRFNTITKRD